MFGIQCLDSYTFHVAFVGNKKQVTDDDTLYFIEIFALYCLYFSFFYHFTRLSVHINSTRKMLSVRFPYCLVNCSFVYLSNLEQIDFLFYSTLHVFFFSIFPYVKVHFPFVFKKLKTKIHFRCVFVVYDGAKRQN